MTPQPSPGLALREALEKITKAARSWHDYHHGSNIVGCDEICELLPECETALAACLPPPSIKFSDVYDCLEFAKALNAGWKKYQELFGKAPRGTVKQFAALLELIPEIEPIAAAQPVTAPAKEGG